MAVLLGGMAWPLGWRVGFLERPYQEVVEATIAWGRADRTKHRSVSGSLMGRLESLAPLQSPPKRELLMPVGKRWTVQVVNSTLGGDSESWVGHLSGVLGCHGVIAMHIPRGQYEFPATMFEYLGPEGEPPLRHIRTVTAGIFDEGRWTFEAHGRQLEFEEPEAYERRLKRERLTREMLVRYLGALGIAVDDEAAYDSEGTLFQSRALYRSVKLSLEDARAQFATKGPAPAAG